MYFTKYVPSWLNDAIIYHIYPLGFFGAPKFSANEPGKVINRFENIRNYYNHFLELGINTIQFGPIFESVSHGYDTTDYFVIDHRLGTNELFKEIVAELHDLGIRVIVDGVFNHVGREFKSFIDIKENRQYSTKKNWHFIDFNGNNSYNDGFSYQDWEGYQELVRLNLSNNEVKDYFFDVCKFWLGDIKIDGWRLDVAYQIDVEFWKEFRKVCKEINSNSVLIGELVHGDYTKWVGEDRLDSGTDYQVQKSIWSSIKSVNMYELKNVIDIAYNKRGRHKDLLMMNFLGNHDTNRIASVIKTEQLIPAFLILLTLHGYPKIYYGDELAVRGEKTAHSDDEIRKPMIDLADQWPEFGKELFKNIQQFITIRKDIPALRYGTIAFIDPIDWDPTIIIYSRETSTQKVIIIVNTQEQTKSVSIMVKVANRKAKFIDYLNKREEFIVTNNKIEKIIIYPHWGRIMLNVD